MAEHAYQLVVRKGPKPGQLFPLNLETMIVGRDPASDIPIDDVEVSRRHARLIQTAEGYQIQDMGSTNGTFVDGKRLGGEPQLLLPGQIIILGSNVNLVYQMVTEPDAFATVVAPLAMAPEEPAAEAEAEEQAAEKAGEAAELPVLPQPPTAIREPAAEEPVELEPIADEHLEIEPIEEQAIVELEAEKELEPIEEEVPAAAPTEPPAEVAAIAALFEEAGEAELEPPAEEEEEEALATILERPFPPPGEEELMPELEEEAPPLPPAEPETVTPFPSFAQVEGQDVVDSGEPMAELEREEVIMAPPPPPPPPPKPQGNNRNRNLIIIAVAIIILLCCCVTAAVLIIFLFVPTDISTSVAPLGAALAASLAGSLS